MRQWLAPLVIEKDLKPSVNSNSMDEDVVLSFSDSGPLRRVRDPGGLELEGLTLRSGSVLKGRSPHMSQISDPQALVEFSTATAQGQAVLSQSESESAITHAVSTAAADSSINTLTYLLTRRTDVVSEMFSNFVAMATRGGRGRIFLTSFNSPIRKMIRRVQSAEQSEEDKMLLSSISSCSSRSNTGSV